MKNTVADINSWRNFSLNKISQLAGIARETVQKRINESNIKPADTQNGFPVYDIWEAARAILAPTVNYDFSDPEKLPPKERRDYYEGTLAKIKVEKEEGVLLDYADVRQIVAEIIKPAINFLHSIPDNLERDYNIPHSAVSKLETEINALLENWANEIEKL